MPPLACELTGRMSGKHYIVCTLFLSRTDPCCYLIEYLRLFAYLRPHPLAEGNRCHYEYNMFKSESNSALSKVAKNVTEGASDSFAHVLQSYSRSVFHLIDRWFEEMRDDGLLLLLYY
jgi:hypothetical protein